MPPQRHYAAGPAVWHHPKNPRAVLYSEPARRPGYLGSYEPALRSKTRQRVASLGGLNGQRLAAASFYYWRHAQGFAGHGRRRLHERLADMIAAASAGSGACTYQWGCCAYCHHGNAVVAASRYLAAADSIQPVRGHVTFTAAGVDDPAELLHRCRQLLARLVAARPGAALTTALLVPSFRSGRAALDGRLHVHAVLDARIGVGAARAAGATLGVEVSLGKQPDNTLGAAGRVLAYALAQMDARAFDHPAFGMREARVQVWTRPKGRTRRELTATMARDGSLKSIQAAATADSWRARKER